MVKTRMFGELEIEKNKFETGGTAMRQEKGGPISQKTKDYVYKEMERRGLLLATPQFKLISSSLFEVKCTYLICLSNKKREGPN